MEQLAQSLERDAVRTWLIRCSDGVADKLAPLGVGVPVGSPRHSDAHFQLLVWPRVKKTDRAHGENCRRHRHWVSGKKLPPDREQTWTTQAKLLMQSCGPSRTLVSLHSPEAAEAACGAC